MLVESRTTASGAAFSGESLRLAVALIAGAQVAEDFFSSRRRRLVARHAARRWRQTVARVCALARLADLADLFVEAALAADFWRGVEEDFYIGVRKDDVCRCRGLP